MGEGKRQKDLHHQSEHIQQIRRCSCTWHSPCSTMGLSVKACECPNAGLQ